MSELFRLQTALATEAQRTKSALGSGKTVAQLADYDTIRRSSSFFGALIYTPRDCCDSASSAPPRPAAPSPRPSPTPTGGSKNSRFSACFQRHRSSETTPIANKARFSAVARAVAFEERLQRHVRRDSLSLHEGSERLSESEHTRRSDMDTEGVHGAAAAVLPSQGVPYLYYYCTEQYS